MKRRDVIAKNIENLWNEELGIYVNKIPENEFYVRLSPTSFYPLISHHPKKEQALMMLKHLVNESEFCVSDQCPFSIPSISRNDPAFHGKKKYLSTYLDNDYWRGRTWAPMNMLGKIK